MSLDLIYPAGIVFGLMLIGVVLTVLEFKRQEGSDGKDKDEERVDLRKK
ncbi:hypothetical protein [Vreelandella utahensis]|nr:hypothetical protein [Halomonas utahensis]